MQHSFDIDVAADVGITAAVIFNNFSYWILHNEKNNLNLHDGKHWVYNSNKALAQLFPYLTVNQITNAISKLRAAGYLETGTYNENKHDRTLWYAFGQKANCILEKSKMEAKKIQNPDCKNTECSIYKDIKTDINKDIKERESAPAQDQQQEPQRDVAATLHNPDHAAKFREWLAVWKETHGGGKDMPRFRQEAQVRLLLTMPEDLRAEAIERAILGGWKALHDTRTLRQEENTPGAGNKLPRDYFTNGKNIPAASEYGTRCDEV